MKQLVVVVALVVVFLLGCTGCKEDIVKVVWQNDLYNLKIPSGQFWVFIEAQGRVEEDGIRVVKVPIILSFGGLKYDRIIHVLHLTLTLGDGKTVYGSGYFMSESLLQTCLRKLKENGRVSLYGDYHPNPRNWVGWPAEEYQMKRQKGIEIEWIQFFDDERIATYQIPPRGWNDI